MVVVVVVVVMVTVTMITAASLPMWVVCGVAGGGP
jgi:hypothetical protein